MNSSINLAREEIKRCEASLSLYTAVNDALVRNGDREHAEINERTISGLKQRIAELRAGIQTTKAAGRGFLFWLRKVAGP